MTKIPRAKSIMHPTALAKFSSTKQSISLPKERAKNILRTETRLTIILERKGTFIPLKPQFNPIENESAESPRHKIKPERKSIVQHLKVFSFYPMSFYTLLLLLFLKNRKPAAFSITAGFLFSKKFNNYLFVNRFYLPVHGFLLCRRRLQEHQDKNLCWL